MIASGDDSIGLYDIEVSALVSADDTSPRVCGAENVRPSGSNPGRKRAATTHDPKKVNAKKAHVSETLCSQMTEAIAIMKEPVKVSDPNESWLDKALNIWNDEFKDADFAVQHAVYGSWSQNLREAKIFVQSSPQYRQWLVEKVTQDLRSEDA